MNIENKIELCKRIKSISDGDKWWLELCVGGLDDPNTQSRISELKSIFNNKWYRDLRNKRNGFGSCPLSILGGAQSPKYNIIDLGENIRVLGGVKNLDNELIHRLKNPNHFLNTWVEIDICACFVKAGYPIELHPELPNRRKCDVKVKVEKEWIWIEIIHLQMSQKEKNDFNLCAQLVEDLKKSIPEMKLTGRIRFLDVVKSDFERLFETIIRKIKTEYRKKGLPINIELNSGQVLIDLCEAQGGLGISVENFRTIEPEEIGRHLVERTLNEYNQLPEEGYGVIICNPISLLYQQLDLGMKTRLNGLLTPEIHKRVSGIIFVNRRARRSGFIKDYPYIIINKFAKKRCDNRIKKLADSLWTF